MALASVVNVRFLLFTAIILSLAVFNSQPRPTRILPKATLSNPLLIDLSATNYQQSPVKMNSLSLEHTPRIEIHKPISDTPTQSFMSKVSPPNPILDPNLKVEDDSNLVLRFISSTGRTFSTSPNKTASFNTLQHLKSAQEEVYIEGNSLFDHYATLRPVYQRYDNSQYRSLGGTEYTSSLFVNPKQYEIPKQVSSANQQAYFSNIKPLPDRVSPAKTNIINNTAPEGTLTFNSSFESGNLFAAYHVSAHEYDLILQNDINTKGNTQWFYFSVAGGKKNQTVRFNIVNLYKSSSLYQNGMKPVVYSTLANKSSSLGIGWSRYGSSITYSKSDISLEGKPNKTYSIFSFNYKFDYDGDLVYFSHCFPYTYTQLRTYLKGIKDKFPADLVAIRTVGYTVLKYPIPMISIGQNIRQRQRKTLKIAVSQSTRNTSTAFSPQDQKESVIILARQHPGQTQGSIMCEGMVNQLLCFDTFESKFMLRHYNFYIFPMVNIDGVVNGNYRSNIYGYDLNRVWNVEKSERHPEVTVIRNEISRIAKHSQIALVIDLHGHSKKMNSFFFGNPLSPNKELDSSRVLPLLASKLCPYVSYKDCTFLREEERAGVARIAIQDMLAGHKDCEVFTFQASFYGTIKNNKKVHFTMEDFRSIGKQLFNAVFKKYSEITKEKKTLKESALLKQLRKEIVAINKGIDRSEEAGSGSDSEIEKIMGSEAHFPDGQIFEEFDKRSTKELNEKRNTSYSMPTETLTVRSQVPTENTYIKIINGKSEACQTDLDSSQTFMSTYYPNPNSNCTFFGNSSTITLQDNETIGGMQSSAMTNLSSLSIHPVMTPYMISKPKRANMTIRGEIEKRRALLMNNSNLSVSSRRDVEAQYKQTYSLKIGLINKLKIMGEKFTDDKDGQYVPRKNSTVSRGVQTELSFLKSYERDRELSYHKTTRVHMNKNTGNTKIVGLDSWKRRASGDQRSTFMKEVKDLSYNITQQVTEMIKVRRIKYRAKAASSYFRQEFVLSEEEDEVGRQGGNNKHKCRLPIL